MTLKINLFLKFIVVIIVACFSVLVSYGQKTKIDSLLDETKLEKQDTTRVNLLNELSSTYIQNDMLFKADSTSDKSIILAEDIDFKKGEAYAYKNKGIISYYRGDYLSVLEHWTRSLEIFEEINHKLGIANISSNLGVVYYDQGSYVKALDYYLKSLSISDELKDPFRISTVLLNIGGVYSQMQEYDKALNYFHIIEQYLEKLDESQIQAAYLMGVGEIYSLKEQHELAIDYFSKALIINKNTTDYAHNLTMLGKEEMSLGNRDKSMEYYNQAYEIAKKSDLLLDQTQTLIAIGMAYQDQDPLKALNSYKEAESLALKMETSEELRDIYLGMSLAYKNSSDMGNAYAYQNKYLEFKDLIFNLETDDKIRGLQFDFDLEKKQDQIGLLEKEAEITRLREKRQKNAFYVSLLISFLIVIIAITIFNRYKYVKKSNKIIEAEKNRSENLLLNILPKETALELKENGKVIAKKFDSVTVLFTDFESFTKHSQKLSPEILVKSVDYYFSKFDEIIEKYGLEKIKTIGDAYMCAGGLPFESNDHPIKIIRAALEITEFMEETKMLNGDGLTHFDVRIGVNTGSVVAGVVGTKKFAYDIWGDTVNVASRMESNSIRGKINISQNTYELIKHDFTCNFRGEISVKNKGMMNMYFVESEKEVVNI